MDEATFDAMYWASFSPDVAALRGIGDANLRGARCFELAQKGRVIDKSIMLEGGGPLRVMTYRSQEGYDWVDSLMTHYIVVVPDIQPQGKQPPGTIKVSLDPKDYPAYVAPPSPVPPPPIVIPSMVGKAYGFNDALGRPMYAAIPPASSTLFDGYDYDKDPRGVFTFHFTTPFCCWFTPKTAKFSA